MVLQRVVSGPHRADREEPDSSVQFSDLGEVCRVGCVAHGARLGGFGYESRGLCVCVDRFHGLESDPFYVEGVAWAEGFDGFDEVLVVCGDAGVVVVVSPEDAGGGCEDSSFVLGAVGHGFDEDFGVGVVVGVAVGDDYAVEFLGAEAGPVGVDDGSGSRVDVDVGVAVDEADARGAAALGDHGEAASACA